MTDIRNFSTAVILTAYREKFLLDDIGKLYDFLGFMTGDRGIMTHQLVPAADAIKPALLEQLPWLGDVPELTPIPDNVTAKQHVGDYLADVCAVYGVEHDLHPAPETWGVHDPLDDLDAITEGKPVVPIVVFAPERDL